MIMVAVILVTVKNLIQGFWQRQPTDTYVFKNAQTFVSYIVTDHHYPDKNIVWRNN